MISFYQIHVKDFNLFTDLWIYTPAFMWDLQKPGALATSPASHLWRTIHGSETIRIIRARHASRRTFQTRGNLRQLCPLRRQDAEATV
jgi:hypothetical protein